MYAAGEAEPQSREAEPQFTCRFREVLGRRFLGVESSVQRLAMVVLKSVVRCKLSGGVQSASSRRGEIEEIV